MPENEKKPKRAKRSTRGRSRGPKAKPVNDGPSQSMDADLPDIDYDEDGGGNEHTAKILRSEIVWSRNDNGEIKTDKRGKQMRNWELDVAFDFAADFEDGVKTVKYPVSRAKNSDYARFRTALREMGWNLKEVGELEGETFIWMGDARDFENAKKELVEWVQWFPVDYVKPVNA